MPDRIPSRDPLADALRSGLISPNVPDNNLEPANVVDVIASLSKSVIYLATTHADAMQRVAKSLDKIAQAINDKTFR